MRIDYTCKFCHKPGWLDFDSEQGIEFQIESWKKMLCCNRCADFMVEKRRIFDSVAKVCRIVEVTRCTFKTSVITETESKAMEKLTRITKKFAAIVCDYCRKSNVWDTELPQMILDYPARSGQILNDYIRHIKTIQ
jgi:hypothetical protein